MNKCWIAGLVVLPLLASCTLENGSGFNDEAYWYVPGPGVGVPYAQHSNRYHHDPRHKWSKNHRYHDGRRRPYPEVSPEGNHHGPQQVNPSVHSHPSVQPSDSHVHGPVDRQVRAPVASQSSSRVHGPVEGKTHLPFEQPSAPRVHGPVDSQTHAPTQSLNRGVGSSTHPDNSRSHGHP